MSLSYSHAEWYWITEAWDKIISLQINIYGIRWVLFKSSMVSGGNLEEIEAPVIKGALEMSANPSLLCFTGIRDAFII